ncbi:MAG: porin [Planctomycetaceae bacterium]|nr:porin [Planctomycetaceae bacterium]
MHRFLIATLCLLLLLTDADSVWGQESLRIPPVGHSFQEEFVGLAPPGQNPLAPPGQPPTDKPAAAEQKPAPPKAAAEPVKYPTVRLTGFFQADAGWVHQTNANIAAVGDAQDGADFRRARLQAVGDVAANMGYSMEFDFAFPGRPSFMDVWLEIRDLHGDANLRVGQYRQPIGLDGMTSVKDLTFLERALPFALLPFRQIGGMLHGTSEDESMTWAASVYRYPTDFFGANIGDNGGYGVVGRATGLAIDYGDDLQLHLGGAYTFADPANDAIRYLNQPEFFVAETGNVALVPIGVPTIMPPFVDTGVIRTNNVNLFGSELAARSGSFHMQSEFLVAVVNRIGGDLAVFPGAYAQAGYILTGEVRPYNKKAGALGRIVPDHPVTSKGGCGAWEVAGRWSWLDLEDSGVEGGRLNDLTFGLNWYLNGFTKFQFNYIRAFLESPVNGHSTADIAAVRAQLDF